MSLNQQPDIVRLANTLGIYGDPQPADAILAYCFKTVQGWIDDIGGVDSLSQLEKLVCNKLRLKLEFLETEEDCARILETYLAKGEVVIKSVLDQLDDATFGAVFERRNYGPKDRDRYVAVIDCRGDKRHRRFFTKWHEIAHILTLKHQLELVLLRDTKVKKPEEQMMDLIAGRIGFYPLIFQRAFRAELDAYGRFDFGLIQRVRDNVCAEASYESTLHACVAALDRPCLLVRVGLGLSKAEQDAASDAQATFFAPQSAVPQLRALSTSGNEAARRSGLRLHRNMRVPVGSHLYRAYYDRDGADGSATLRENLAVWSHSDGRQLTAREVTVYTRLQGEQLLALMVDELVLD
jgi:hypothetical protein